MCIIKYQIHTIFEIENPMVNISIVDFVGKLWKNFQLDFFWAFNNNFERIFYIDQYYKNLSSILWLFIELK